MNSNLSIAEWTVKDESLDSFANHSHEQRQKLNFIPQIKSIKQSQNNLPLPERVKSKSFFKQTTKQQLNKDPILVPILRLIYIYNNIVIIIRSCDQKPYRQPYKIILNDQNNAISNLFCSQKSTRSNTPKLKIKIHSQNLNFQPIVLNNSPILDQIREEKMIYKNLQSKINDMFTNIRTKQQQQYVGRYFNYKRKKQFTLKNISELSKKFSNPEFQ